jgi:hypothetical protein
MAMQMKRKSRILAIAMLMITVSGTAIGQTKIDFDLGVRGGAFSGGIPMEVPNGHYFPDTYTAETHPYTFGPTVGIQFNDHIEVRFEAVRSRFRFQDQSGTPFPAALSKYTSVSDGSIWQYPILLTYHVGNGAVRPFGGGGLSFGSAFKGTTHTVTTSVVGPLPPNPNTPPNTVTTFSTTAFKPTSNPTAFYLSGGVEGRISFFSIRPEIRYTHWTGFDMRSNIGIQDDTILFSGNQVEFVLGVSINPFRFKKEIVK